MCEVVGMGLYWNLIGKIMGVVCEVVSGFLHGVVELICQWCERMYLYGFVSL